MRNWISLAVLGMVMRAAFLLCRGQSHLDPIPDSLKLEIVTAHRDYLKADADYQAEMRRLNEVELRRARAKRRLDAGQDKANRACGPAAAFDLDKLACVPIPGR